MSQLDFKDQATRPHLRRSPMRLFWIYGLGNPLPIGGQPFGAPGGALRGRGQPFVDKVLLVSTCGDRPQCAVAD